MPSEALPAQRSSYFLERSLKGKETVMNCPRCNTPLPNDARFCSVCGLNLTAGAGATPPPPTPNVANAGGNVGQGIQIDSDGRGAGRGYQYEIHYQGAFALAI